MKRPSAEWLRLIAIVNEGRDAIAVELGAFGGDAKVRRAVELSMSKWHPWRLQERPHVELGYWTDCGCCLAFTFNSGRCPLNTTDDDADCHASCVMVGKGRDGPYRSRHETQQIIITAMRKAGSTLEKIEGLEE